MSTLTGACFVFQFVGLVGITAVSALACHVTIMSDPALVSDDSTWYAFYIFTILQKCFRIC